MTTRTIDPPSGLAENPGMVGEEVERQPDAQPALVVRRLGKTYRLYQRPVDRLLELFGRRRHVPFEALSGVDLTLRRGESLGIVGENGAGKSTLLKILAGVTTATTGAVEVHGSVGSLLELGMGFHPEFTGRQNIRVNAAIMGLSEQEVAAKLPEIVEFSELGEFIERPVKTYSTGMAMRLGFAIAAQLEPEILIIDEALSVGDGYFQKKCMDRLQELVGRGVTLLFCSHAMYYVTAFCQRALWLRGGEVAALGPAAEVVREYERFLLAKRAAAGEPEVDEPRPGPARLVSARLEGGRKSFRHGEPLALEVEWNSEDPSLDFHLGIGFDRIDGVQVLSFGTAPDGLDPVQGAAEHSVRLVVPELPILQGIYAIYVYLLDGNGLHVYDRMLLERAFSVESDGYSIGLFRAGHRWEVGTGVSAAAGR